MGYIEAVDKLSRQARDVIAPPESEIAAARHVLSRSPVAGYAPFTEAEARLLGAYRESLNPRTVSGRTDDVWEDILRDERLDIRRA